VQTIRVVPKVLIVEGRRRSCVLDLMLAELEGRA